MDKAFGSELKKYIIIVLLISLAKTNYIGGFGGVGFSFEPSARDFALAGATVANGTSGFYPFSNPASLPNVKSWEFSSSYFFLGLDRSVQVMSISKNLPPSAGISISAYKSGTEGIEGRSSTNQSTGMYYSTSDYYGMISFGVSPSKTLSIGINVKAYFSSMKLNSPFNDPSSNGVFFDVGGLYNVDKMTIGFKYENVGTSLKWKIDEGGHNQFTYNESIPEKLSLGFNYMIMNNLNLLFQQDILFLNDQDINYRSKIATEYKIRDFSIRAGLAEINTNFVPRLGIGFSRKIFSATKITFDYSLDCGKVTEGMNNSLSLIISY